MAWKFIANIRGQRGPRGDPGKSIRGLPGVGERGPTGPMPRHEWKESRLRFEIERDKWGPWVELRGEKGEEKLFFRATKGGGGVQTAAVNARPVEIGPDFGDGTSSVTLSVGTVSLTAVTTSYANDRDTWWPDVALCPDDANKDDTNIQVEGVVATKKVGVSGWDVSTFPSGTTVSAATARFVVQTAPAAVDGTDRIRLITAATEGWNEAVVKCSDNPDDNGQAANDITVVGANNGGAQGDVHSIALNATARTRLQNRMGTGTFSLLIDSTSVATTNHAFFDRENGSAAQRPLLSFDWSKTL